MFKLCRKILNSQIKNQLKITSKFCEQKSTRWSGSYQGDGKTKVNILNMEIEMGLMINSYSQVGFRLNNGLNVIGPMAIFQR